MGAVAPAKPVRCPKCGRSFASEVDLKYHECTGSKSKRDDEPVGVA